MSVNSTNIFDNNILSANTSSEGSISKEQITGEMIEKLQEILIKQFPNNPQRQRIKVYPDRINFAAPCCGDSLKDNSKKRGNIILTGGGAMMDGVIELAQNVFKTSSVRLGVPELLGGIPEDYRRPDYATVIGLVLANKSLIQGKDNRKKSKVHGAKKAKEKSGESVFKKIFKSLF